MSNVIDFAAKKAERLAKENAREVVHEDPFIRVFEDGSLEYSEAGVAEFREPFEYAGLNIDEITSLQQHAKALDSIRFSAVPPYT